MFNIIKNIINFTGSSSSSYYSSEEQLYITIAGCVICIVFVVTIDLLIRVFKNYLK